MESQMVDWAELSPESIDIGAARRLKPCHVRARVIRGSPGRKIDEEMQILIPSQFPNGVR